MPQIKNYNTNINSIPDANIPKQYDDIIYVNNNAIEQNPITEIVGSIVYANTTAAINAEELFSQIRNRIPEIVGSSGITNSVFLELLSSVIALFTSEAGHKWNFLTVENKIQLQPGVVEYELSNYDQMIAVFLEPNCRLNASGRKVEILQSDSQRKDFINGFNFFEMVGGNIRLINIKIENELERCNYCKKCNLCNLFSGTINVHYHINPTPPKTMQESIMWFPKNPKALEYFKERLIEDIYIRSGSTLQLSSKASILLNDLLKWDSPYMKIQNKQSSDFKLFNFQNIHNKRV